MEPTEALALDDYGIEAEMVTVSADGGPMSVRLPAVACGVGADQLVVDASVGGQPSSPSPSTKCDRPCATGCIATTTLRSRA